MSELTVAAGFVDGLMRYASGRGASRDRLLRFAQLTERDLEDPDARLPLSTFLSLIRFAKLAANDRAIALHFGHDVDLRDVSVIGLLAQSCRTTMEVFEQVNRFSALWIDTGQSGDRFVLVRKDGQLWMVDKRPQPNGSPEFTETAFGRTVAIAQRLGTERPITAAHFTFPDPGYADEYARVLGAPPTFDAEWNALRLVDGFMELPVALQPRYSFHVIEAHADRLLRELRSRDSTRATIERRVLAALPARVELNEIARGMGVSRQTLHRKLKAEGTTFATILDEVRKELAMAHLHQGTPVDQTALAVGFAERSAFSRAFKRWTGTSPAALLAKKT